MTFLYTRRCYIYVRKLLLYECDKSYNVGKLRAAVVRLYTLLFSRDVSRIKQKEKKYGFELSSEAVLRTTGDRDIPAVVVGARNCTCKSEL